MAVSAGPALALARAQSRDVLRQRGVWRIVVLLPLVYLLAAQVVPALAEARGQERHALLRYRLAVAGDVEAARPLLDHLAANRFLIEEAADAKHEVEHGDAYLGMVVRAEGGPFGAGGRLLLTVHVITTLEPSRTGSGLLFAAVAGFSDAESARRVGLALAGDGPAVPAIDLAVEDLSLGAERGRAAIARSLPLLLLVALLPNVRHLGGPLRGGAGGGPFEWLLTLPVSRGTVLTGLGVAGLVLCAVVAVVVVAGVGITAIAVEAIADRRTDNLPLLLVTSAVAALLVAVPVVALGLVAGAYARSDDEASRFELLLAPLFVLGLLGQAGLGLGSHPLVLALPVVGAAVGGAELVEGTLTAGETVVMAASSIGGAAVLLAVADRLLARERTVLASRS